MGDCSWRWLWGGANIPDIRDRGGGWLWVRLHGGLRWLRQHCTPSGTLLWLRGKPWCCWFHRDRWGWQGSGILIPFLEWDSCPKLVLRMLCGWVLFLHLPQEITAILSDAQSWLENPCCLTVAFCPRAVYSNMTLPPWAAVPQPCHKNVV